MPVKGSGGQLGPFIREAADMDKLWRRLNNGILWATKEDLAYYSSIDTMVTDCMGLADKATFSIDIGKDLWVTPSRWNTLIRQYVDPERLFAWLEGVKEISTYKRGIVALDMNPVQRTVVASNARANRRKWGGCMRMVTYRAFPQPTVTLFSRTSYLGYIGGLDMLCAFKLIEVAADMIGEGLKTSDFRFRWFADTLQFHGFKSAAFVFASGQQKLMEMERWPEGQLIRGQQIGPEENYPTWKIVRSWWRRIKKQDREGVLYSQMKYGAEKRIRRRYHGQRSIDQSRYLTDGGRVYTPLTTPVELITIDRMLYATPESRAIIKRQKTEKTTKLIDSLFSDDDVDEILGIDEEDYAELR